jgi:yecA family protein
MEQPLSKMPPFDRFDHLLNAIELEVGASEIHGVISGLLCIGHTEAHADWFADLFDNRSSDDLLVREARQLLGQLYQTTRIQIDDEDLEFSPYLPSDSLSLQERAKCLSEWCQGFLYGLGLAGVDEGALSGDAREALKDLSEFTKLDDENIELDEASEAAYVELQEFLRIATLLIWEELSTFRKAANEPK